MSLVFTRRFLDFSILVSLVMLLAYILLGRLFLDFISIFQGEFCQNRSLFTVIVSSVGRRPIYDFTCCFLVWFFDLVVC